MSKSKDQQQQDWKSAAVPHLPYVLRQPGDVIRGQGGYHVVIKEHVSTNIAPPVPGASDDNYHWTAN